MEQLIPISHADLVTTHECNMRCPFCIDKFRGQKGFIPLPVVDGFLNLLKERTCKTTAFRFDTNPNLEVLLLGGEPTLMTYDYLFEVASMCHKRGFQICMSTNGVNEARIREVLPFFDWVQITVHNEAQIDKWADWTHNVNLKFVGDERMTLTRFLKLSGYSKLFDRRSMSMYFTPKFEELCTDKDLWNVLDKLAWERQGSYWYAFLDGVRIKKCVKGETNIIDEPLIPKLYPNGNYNKTWQNEDNDPYLGEIKGA